MKDGAGIGASLSGESDENSLGSELPERGAFVSFGNQCFHARGHYSIHLKYQKESLKYLPLGAPFFIFVSVTHTSLFNRLFIPDR